MAMFPPKSPQTVRMGSAASCTVFAQQERAFLSSPPTARGLPRHDSGTTDRVETVHSAKMSAPQSSAPSPTAATLSGDKLPDGKDEREVTANNDRRLAGYGLSSQKGRASMKDSGMRRSRSRACSDAAKNQGAHDTLAFGARHPKQPVDEALPVADCLGSNGKPSITAIHARRLDRETGLTFIETNYKKGNEAPFVFVNQVM
ncbi:uncharacterized protein PHACADRAFT_257720 [Phanerochaete carnosa HHB-10118-sp]|uniref:Uncharacterized protein n=1 Tax=Phanerochaete carnosa (strain HHB-10118-sp) TaxID=650164 RepID=K5W4L8_PHACS|nr:uncharacterized protein PHACADRAFT_257720 [Phanerochaete carnosa HHB-10118-sp]EKM54105.1 hypothetical protein PHACADRAFT_257720 [Phanerochaete carnosa HHB-10118-sp]